MGNSAQHHLSVTGAIIVNSTPCDFLDDECLLGVALLTRLERHSGGAGPELEPLTSSGGQRHRFCFGGKDIAIE